MEILSTATSSLPPPTTSFKHIQDNDNGDAMCNILEILNFSVVSNNKIRNPHHSHNSSLNVDNDGDGNKIPTPGSEDHNSELIIQHAMISRELLEARVENEELRKRLSELSSQVEVLNIKENETQEKLKSIATFTNVLQTEFALMLKNLSGFVKEAKNGGRKDFNQNEFLEFVGLLDKLSNKIPVIDWTDTKNNFTRLNDLLTKKTSDATVSSTAISTTAPEMSPPATVTSSTATPTGTELNNVNRSYPEVAADELENLPQPTTRPVEIGSQFHAKSITSQNSFICGICDTSYPSSIAFMGHVACCHNGCYPCNQIFETPEILAYHNQQFHPHGVPWPVVPPNPLVQPNVHYSGNQNHSLSREANSHIRPLGQSNGNLFHPNCPSLPSCCGVMRTTTWQPKQHGILASSDTSPYHKCLCGETFLCRSLLNVHVQLMNKV